MDFSSDELAKLFTNPTGEGHVLVACVAAEITAGGWCAEELRKYLFLTVVEEREPSQSM